MTLAKLLLVVLAFSIVSRQSVRGNAGCSLFNWCNGHGTCNTETSTYVHTLSRTRCTSALVIFLLLFLALRDQGCVPLFVQPLAPTPTRRLCKARTLITQFISRHVHQHVRNTRDTASVPLAAQLNPITFSNIIHTPRRSFADVHVTRAGEPTPTSLCTALRIVPRVFVLPARLGEICRRGL